MSGFKNRTSWTTQMALHNWCTLCTTHFIMAALSQWKPVSTRTCSLFLPFISTYLSSHKSLKEPTYIFKVDLAASENISQNNKTPVLKQLVISLPVLSSNSCRAWGLFPWTLISPCTPQNTIIWIHIWRFMRPHLTSYLLFLQKTWVHIYCTLDSDRRIMSYDQRVPPLHLPSDQLRPFQCTLHGTFYREPVDGVE